MTKLTNPKSALLVFIITLSMFSCKKKENTPEATNETPTTTQPACFNVDYNGNYTGSGFLDSSGTSNPYTTGHLTVLKTGCETADVDLSVSAKSYNFSEHITNITSSTSGYTGKRPNGKSISFALGSGNRIYVTADSAFTFNGIKP